MSLDIIIPVYNEGPNIVAVLEGLRSRVRTPFRVLIVYDHDNDDTLMALSTWPRKGLALELIKNRGAGPLEAVLTGFSRSDAVAALMFPADDIWNGGIIDRMVELNREGCDIVCGSRFLPGGVMTGCPWLKAVLVRAGAWALHALARLPTRDASNGLRLFSRRVLSELRVESTLGFAFSIELLVKAHRRGWRVGEVPAVWHQRSKGVSRFRVIRWLPDYLRWFFYAFATTWLRRR